MNTYLISYVVNGSNGDGTKKVSFHQHTIRNVSNKMAAFEEFEDYRSRGMHPQPGYGIISIINLSKE